MWVLIGYGLSSPSYYSNSTFLSWVGQFSFAHLYVELNQLLWPSIHFHSCCVTAVHCCGGLCRLHHTYCGLRHLVTIRTYTTDFIYFYVYWYWSHCDSHLHLSTGLWPHCSGWLMCSLLLWLRAMPYCSLWPIVAVTLLFLWCLLFTLLYCSHRVFSQACWVACSPRLDFFVVLQ